jgi:hypothetical protein
MEFFVGLNFAKLSDIDFQLFKCKYENKYGNHIGRSFKFPLNVGVEESIVNARTTRVKTQTTVS